MKNKFFYLLVCLAATLSSCEPPVTFTEPQPAQSGNLSSFPRKLRGMYFCPADSSLLRIDSKTICRVFQVDAGEGNDEKGIELHISGDTSLQQANAEENQIAAGSHKDPQQTEMVDTIYSLDKGHVLKKFRGYYFINRKYENEGWEVQRLSLKKGKLTINSISLDKDIEDLKEIAESAEDTVAPYQFTVTKKQFKEFNRGTGFSHEDVFLKMK